MAGNVGSKMQIFDFLKINKTAVKKCLAAGFFTACWNVQRARKLAALLSSATYTSNLRFHRHLYIKSAVE